MYCRLPSYLLHALDAEQADAFQGGLPGTVEPGDGWLGFHSSPSMPPHRRTVSGKYTKK